MSSISWIIFLPTDLKEVIYEPLSRVVVQGPRLKNYPIDNGGNNIIDDVVGGKPGRMVSFQKQYSFAAAVSQAVGFFLAGEGRPAAKNGCVDGRPIVGNDFLRPFRQITLEVSRVWERSVGVEAIRCHFVDKGGQITPASINARWIDPGTLSDHGNGNTLSPVLLDELFNGLTNGTKDKC